MGVNAPLSAPARWRCATCQLMSSTSRARAASSCRRSLARLLRALPLMQQADVVVYDRLVATEHGLTQHRASLCVFAGTWPSRRTAGRHHRARYNPPTTCPGRKPRHARSRGDGGQFYLAALNYRWRGGTATLKISLGRSVLMSGRLMFWQLAFRIVFIFKR